MRSLRSGVLLIVGFASAWAAVGLTAASALPSANQACQPQRGVVFDCNWIVNGGFEDEIGSLDIQHVVTPSAWQTFGHATVLQYAGFDGLPVSSDHDLSVKAPLGKNFLAGGPHGTVTRDAKAWQSVNLARATPRITRGRVFFELSAVFGGRTGKPDYGRMWVAFYDGHSKDPIVPEVGVAPVLRSDRQGETKFLPRSCYERVPKTARYAVVSIGLFGLTNWDNHAYVDDVRFALRAKPPEHVYACSAAHPKTEAALTVAAFRVDDKSRACLDKEYGIVATFMGVIVLFGASFWLYGKRKDSTRRGQAIDVVYSVGAALVLGLTTLAYLHAANVFAYASCGFPPGGSIAAMFPLPWLHAPLLFCGLAALDILGLRIVFMKQPPTLPQKTADRVLVFSGGFLLALIVLLISTPNADFLDRLNAMALLLIPFIYLMFPYRDRIRTGGLGLKLALIVVLVIPLLQPATTMHSILVINDDRIQRDVEHRYYDLNINGDRGRFSGVSFYVPASLEYTESARVLFSSHLDTTDVAPKSCITPRFTAPGYRVQEVSADPAPLVPGRVWWEWVITPEREGRQFVFLDVLYSPKCKHSSAANGSTDSGFVTLISKTDAAWVSRHWFSVDNFAGALAFFTTGGALLAVVVVVLDLLERVKKAKKAGAESEDVPK